MDYIISYENIPYLIEINSIPGMSKESIIPQIIKAEKLKLKHILNQKKVLYRLKVLA